MKIPKFPTDAFKKPLKTMEIIALVIFVIFLLFPFQIPSDLAYFVNSVGGVLVILIIIVLLFVNAHPVVAIVYLLVAYEVVRRSGKSKIPSSGSCKQNKNLKMNPINNTDEINDTDKDYVANYDETVPNTMLPYETNYASIGVNSNDSDREKELARINPPVEVGNSLEEQVIRQRIPSNALHTNTTPESSDFSPVYDNTSNLSIADYV